MLLGMCVISGQFTVHISVRFRSHSEANGNTHLKMIAEEKNNNQNRAERDAA